MAKYKVLQGIAGSEYTHSAGDVVEFEDADEAERLLNAAIIELDVAKPKAKPKRETATRGKVETAVDKATTED